MSQEAIEDLSADEHFKVGTTQILLRTYHRSYGNRRTQIYFFRLHFGKLLLAKLHWTITTTEVKFVWGQDVHLGLLHLIPVFTPESGVRLASHQSRSIGRLETKHVPKMTHRCKRLVALEYAITPPDEESSAILELKLPSDFYVDSSVVHQKPYPITQFVF